MLTVFDEGGRLAAKLKRSELPELQKLDGDKTEKMWRARSEYDIKDRVTN
jgi:hypothetical protein